MHIVYNVHIQLTVRDSSRCSYILGFLYLKILNVQVQAPYMIIRCHIRLTSHWREKHRLITLKYC